MTRLLLFMLIVEISQGFLLDNSNASFSVKPTYLTAAEYYGDKSKLHNDLEDIRNQQDRALKLLADQLQQRLLAMEQKIHNDKDASNQQSLNVFEQKYKELEKKYIAMKETWEHNYKELEQNYTELIQTVTLLKKQNQLCVLNNSKQQNEIDNLKATDGRMGHKTDNIQQELEQLKQLKSVNSLQTLSILANKVNTFDSRISLLSGHEQSRNQDFLALYNLTTVTSSRLDMLSNLTDSKIFSLSQRQNMSTTQLQQTIAQNNKNVVLVACNQGNITHYDGGSTYKFPSIVTQAGFSGLTSFTSTGKFMCPSNGVYHISLVINSYQDHCAINIMKNSRSMHRQYITGETDSNWSPGSAIIALELKLNDTIWIESDSKMDILYSCFTIFKL